MVEILEVTQVNNALAEMVALFLVDLRSYKGIVSKPNIDAGREEMEEYLSAKFPVFAALIDGEYAGYVVCRIDSEVVWVESIFVKRNTVVTVLLLLCTAKRKKSPLLMAMIPFTTTFTPTITA